MARRIFISFHHKDRMKAKGFNLLRWNKNVGVEFVGRHLLDPVDSKNEDYIRQKVGEQLKGTSVTVVLIGKETADSDWVKYEIERSLNKDKPNGVLGIRLEPGVGIPALLTDCGAEIVDWKPEVFDSAIERAALAAKRILQIGKAHAAAGLCGR